MPFAPLTPLEQERERGRHRRSRLTADVEPEQAADRRACDLDELRVQADVARLERKVVEPLNPLVAVREAGTRVAVDPRRGAVELELLLDRKERALHIEAAVVDPGDRQRTVRVEP